MALRTHRSIAYLEETVNRRASCHPAPRCGVQWRGSPRTTMRGPERKGEAFICRYSWIPHQVRNDREGISGFRVAPGHPAPRCGVHWRESPRTTMRGPERKGEAFICRYFWIPHQVRNDVKHRSMTRECGMTGRRYSTDKKGIPSRQREYLISILEKTLFYLNRSSPKYSGRWKSGFSTGMGDQLR